MRVKCEPNFYVKQGDKYIEQECMHGATHIALHIFSVEKVISSYYNSIHLEDEIVSTLLVGNKYPIKSESKGRWIYTIFNNVTWAYSFDQNAIYINNTVIEM